MTDMCTTAGRENDDASDAGSHMTEITTASMREWRAGFGLEPSSKGDVAYMQGRFVLSPTLETGSLLSDVGGRRGYGRD